MRRLRLVLCLLASPLLAHCAGSDLKPVLAPDQVTTSSRDAEEAARLISAYRKSHGLGPVSTSAQLNEAAAYQARVVAEAGHLSHGNFAGRMDDFKVAGVSAENLSAGSTSVAGALARWKASPGHNENLLMREARHVGLARADSPGHGYQHYWALVLAQ